MQGYDSLLPHIPPIYQECFKIFKSEEKLKKDKKKTLINQNHNYKCKNM